jgi:zona occludens toxin (predicted ATPase)
MDSALRSLLEWTYRYRKMNFFGSAVQNQYLVYSYSGDGSGKPLSKPSVKTYERRVFECYKSYVSSDIKELGIMKHVNILKHPVFYALPVLLGVFLYLFFKSGFSHGEVLPGHDAAKKRMAAAPEIVSKPVQESIVPVVALQSAQEPDKSVMLGDGVKSASSGTVSPYSFFCVGKFVAGDEIFFLFVRSSDVGQESRRNYRLKMRKGFDLSVEVGQAVELAPDVAARLI